MLLWLTTKIWHYRFFIIFGKRRHFWMSMKLAKFEHWSPDKIPKYSALFSEKAYFLWHQQPMNLRARTYVRSPNPKNVHENQKLILVAKCFFIVKKLFHSFKWLTLIPYYTVYIQYDLFVVSKIYLPFPTVCFLGSFSFNCVNSRADPRGCHRCTSNSQNLRRNKNG